MRRRRAPFVPRDPPRKHPCAVCFKVAHHWHHLISQQLLRRYVDRQGLMDRDAYALERRLVNDHRNLQALCVHCHLDQKKGLSGIVPSETIPDCAWEFARELDMEYVLERRYGPEPRDHQGTPGPQAA